MEEMKLMIVINSAQTPPSRATRTAGDYAEATLKAKSRWSVKYGSIRRLDKDPDILG